jgi:hypothetical protein
MARLTCVAIVALVVLLGVLACGDSGPDRDSWVKANDALFSELPLFPGAKLREKDTTASEEEDGRILDYTTRYVLELPPAARRDEIESFYRKRLREPTWHLDERLEGPGGPVLNYVNKQAHVSINLLNSPIHQMEIAVNHDYRR